VERTTKEMWMWKLENEGDSRTTRMKETMADSRNDEGGRKTLKV
jgi:hypothetical protein